MWRQLAVGAALPIISERVTGQRLGVRTLLWASFIVQIVCRARHPGHNPFFRVILWCDDPQHQAYNTLCRAPLGASAETLRRSDPQYDLIIITDWNWPKLSLDLGQLFLCTSGAALAHRRRGVLQWRVRIWFG